MDLSTRKLALAVLGAALVTSFSSYALDWRIGVGGHDFIVEQADSHTLGAGAKFSFSHKTESDIDMSGYIDVFVDHDKDKLDPDHIPVWFSARYLTRQQWFNVTENSAVYWEVAIDGKRNTVSSVEKQLKLFPAISYGYSSNAFYVGVKAAAGYYSLEIDDDVPRMRGYDREDFENETGAYAVGVDGKVVIDSDFELSASIQHWNDGSEMLENQYGVALNYDSNRWIEDSQFIISITHTEYNLDHYAKVDVEDPDYLPILPWDNDTLVRFYIDIPWGA